MAKRKISLGEGGIKGLLANHVEKLLLAIAVGLAAMLIWSGFSNRVGIAANRTPVALKEEVDRATRHVSSFSWKQHFEEKRTPDETQGLETRAAQTLEKMKEDAYAMQQLILPPVSTPRTKRSDPKLLPVTALQANFGYGALLKRTTGRSRRDEADEAELFGDDESNTRPDLDPDIFRPIPQGYNVGGSGSRRRSNNDTGKGVYFVVVTGVIPYRDQLKLYQSSLLNASAFSSTRDAPNYVYWILERSAVEAGSDNRDWKKIRWGDAKKEEERLGAGGQAGGREGQDRAIDPRAIDPLLTRPGPPLVARNLDRLYRHDQILSFEEARIQLEAERSAKADASSTGAAKQENDDDAIVIDDGLGAATGRRGVGRQEPGMMPQGAGEEQMEMRRPQRPGFMASDPISDNGGAADPSEVPEYKMFRYVDLNVQPGQSYVYRLKVFLEDPNFPLNRSAEPPESSLEGAVTQRRKEKKKKIAAGKSRNSVAFRATEFSEESNSVAIKAGARMLAGPVKRARATVPRGEGMAFVRTGEEPTAQAMALEFDVERAADIPGTIEVRRGTVANFKIDETEVLRPSLNSLEKIEDHQFQLNLIVLDLRGGNEHKFEELNAPGTILVMDSRGRLNVLSELGDQEEFQGNIFPEEDKKPGRERGLDEGRERRPEGPPNFGGRE